MVIESGTWCVACLVITHEAISAAASLDLHRIRYPQGQSQVPKQVDSPGLGMDEALAESQRSIQTMGISQTYVIPVHSSGKTG
jgi:hypothetical protein